MDQTKKWWQSKTIWGSIITVVSVIAGLLGYTIDPELQNQLTIQITAIAAGIGGIISAYGRIKAEKKIN